MLFSQSVSSASMSSVCAPLELVPIAIRLHDNGRGEGFASAEALPGTLRFALLESTFHGDSETLPHCPIPDFSYAEPRGRAEKASSHARLSSSTNGTRHREGC